MKVVCLLILFALTCQLQLSSDMNGNPLNARTFEIVSSPKDTSIIGTRLTFTDTQVRFKTNCGLNIAPYKVGQGNVIAFLSKWTSSTFNCQSASDDAIKSLLSRAIRYQLDGSEVSFINSGQRTVMTIKLVWSSKTLSF